MRRRLGAIACACGIGTVAMTAGVAEGTFHLMQIEQVIGGVAGDTSAQAVQLRMRSPFQNLLAPSRVVAYDANGANPVVLVDFTTSVPNDGTGVRILVASASFANYTDTPLAADFTMTNLIPQSYLSAGRITFETDNGVTKYWSLAYGGSAYTGPTTGSLNNDANGDYGPPYPGPLPSDSDRALLFQGAANALSTSNDVDYALTTGAAVFTNNAGASFTVAAPESAPPVTPGECSVKLDLVAQGLTAPVYATHAGDGSGRLFVVDQVGFIRIIDPSGNLLPTPFLDLTSLIVTVNAGFDERGALGLAFHPDYQNNGRFFVRYSAPRTGTSGEPCFGTTRGCHKEVLAEFVVSADPNVADPTPLVLFEIDEPQFNHNSGNVTFGPDGFLYFTLGDGGGAHDGLADSPPSHGPIGNGQNKDTLLGSMLRIDVDAGFPYAIPPTNPFLGVDGADEIFAYGFRNPYRFSFDDGPGGNNTLYVADVGQALFEEVNVVVNGGNYGWVTREGFHCFDPFNPSSPPASCATTGPDGEPLLDPIAEYGHDDGIAVVGGFVYRGSAIPPLVGKYVFGDFSRGFGSPDGRLFFIDTNGTLADVFEMQRFEDPNPLGRFVLGFGEDQAGELYMLTSGNLGPTGTTGTVHKLVPPLPDCIGDLDGDGSTTVLDFGVFAPNFGNAVPPFTNGDLDGDGDVDVFDFALFAANFACSP